MPHGIGSPRDFDPDFQPEPEIAPQNPNGPIRRLEDELEAANLGAANAAPDQELILGPTDEELGEYDFVDPFAEAAAGDQMISGNELMAYLEAMKPEYVVTPGDLALLKTEGIITVDEARTYLAGKGVIA